MVMLSNSFQEFARAILAGRSVHLEESGEWCFIGFFAALWRRIWAGGAPLIATVALPLLALMDRLERMPVRFGTAQLIDWQGYELVAEAVLKRLRDSAGRSCMRLAARLEQRLIALRARLAKKCPSSLAKENLTQLQKLASEWKSQQEILRFAELNWQDCLRLKEAASYPEFVLLLFKEPELRAQFFSYALRDCLEVPFFVEFPALREELFVCNLQGRIGRMGGELLKIEMVPCPDCPMAMQKIVTLPFESCPINILNPDEEVCFRGNYRLKIAEIFEIFKDKQYKVGNLELMAEGIVNWNVHQLGSWNEDAGHYEVVSVSREEWWKQLPLFEVITREEAQARYGNHLNGSVWNAAATSTRGRANLDYNESHSFLELAIPHGKNHYAIYDFGKFALRFPRSFSESVMMFCHTLPATVAYPDENVFYTDRQHAHHSFALTQNQGRKLLEALRLDLIKARAGNFVYQIESENCAKWLHEKLEIVCGKLYNIFLMKLLDTEPVGFVGWIFSSIRRLPTSFQVPLLTLFHLFLGAAQKIWILENNEYVCHSLSTHRFWHTGEVFLPAFLHKQLEEGVLPLVSNLSQSKTQRSVDSADLYSSLQGTAGQSISLWLLPMGQIWLETIMKAAASCQAFLDEIALLFSMVNNSKRRKDL